MWPSNRDDCTSLQTDGRRFLNDFMISLISILIPLLEFIRLQSHLDLLCPDTCNHVEGSTSLSLFKSKHRTCAPDMKIF